MGRGVEVHPLDLTCLLGVISRPSVSIPLRVVLVFLPYLTPSLPASLVNPLEFTLSGP